MAFLVAVMLPETEIVVTQRYAKPTLIDVAGGKMGKIH